MSDRPTKPTWQNRTKAVKSQLRNPVVIALALLVTVFGVAFAAFVVQVQNDHRATQKAEHAANTASAALAHANTALVAVSAQQARQHLQLQQGCQRLNIQRATANRAYLGQYNVDRVVLVFSLRAPVTPQTRRFDHEFLPNLQGAVANAAWTPLTDCVLAVTEKGSAYQAPTTIYFHDRAPPASALDPINARLPTPKGSVP